ncbi:helix-turn-helix domain-containing protein [Coprococcus sp. AM11-30B]|uniref:helix-turn-helix domain-containing protein n=1 Tax=Coprococcus sp. AM11-30B TaxID=2997950 RepID=UPI0022E6B74B|nr:helix-turn-helix domain-containing protein [Coprococcus sp. AM11-30B]
MPHSIYESITNNQSFPVNIFVAPIQSSTYHWHNEYEMIGILKGSIWMQVQSEQVRLKKGDIYLVNPNVIHAIKGVENEENLCMFVQMSRELLAFDEEDNKEVRFYLDSTDEEEPEKGFAYFYKKMAELVYESMREDRHQVFRIRAQVCTMIADLFDQVIYDIRFKDAAAQNDQELTVKAITLMEEHMGEEKVMDLVCKKIGLSRKSLDRNLKTTLDLTGKELMENLRIEQAKNLLKNTDKNMNYILDACGFGSEKTFYRVFREETGFTPKAFREKGQVEEYDEALKGYLNYETSEVKRILREILNG